MYIYILFKYFVYINIIQIKNKNYKLRVTNMRYKKFVTLKCSHNKLLMNLFAYNLL